MWVCMYEAMRAQLHSSIAPHSSTAVSSTAPLSIATRPSELVALTRPRAWRRLPRIPCKQGKRWPVESVARLPARVHSCPVTCGHFQAWRRRHTCSSRTRVRSRRAHRSNIHTTRGCPPPRIRPTNESSVARSINGGPTPWPSSASGSMARATNGTRGRRSTRVGSCTMRSIRSYPRVGRRHTQSVGNN